MASKEKSQKTTSERFGEMVDWVMHDMDKEPKTTGEMMAQSFGAVGRTLVLLGWVYAKTLGFMFRGLRRMIRVVFKRGKKKKDAQPADMGKDSPAFIPLQTAQQLAQQQQAGNPANQPAQQPAQPIPTEFPSQQLAQPAVQQPVQPDFVPPTPPTVQPPAQPPVQPPAQPPAQLTTPPVPPMQRPASRIVPPAPQGIGKVNEVNEQLLFSFIKIGENLKSTHERLERVEQYLAELDKQIDDIYNRLNMVQGIQSAPKSRIQFTK